MDALLGGKVVLVPGGARGIGRATAEAMAREGAAVVVADVDDDAGRRTADAIVAAGGRARFERLDVTDAGSVERVIAGSASAFGGLDVLVNNAGIVRDARLVKMTADQWDSVIDVNLKGVFLCGQAAARAMVEAGRGGAIVNISSVVGLYGNYGQSNYAAAKAGVIGMTRTWARELGRSGVRVNAVAPGFIATDILNTMPAKVVDLLKERTPLARLGQPGDVAEACVWLASDRAAFVTGAVLSVDGGLVL
jgi:3-oxoacyl-[acyl-carrier protein] reductase